MMQAVSVAAQLPVASLGPAVSQRKVHVAHSQGVLPGYGVPQSSFWRTSLCSAPGGSVLAGERGQKYRVVRVAAEGKGFGKVVQKTKKSTGKAEKGPEEATVNVCPCGGGEEKKVYASCCGRYHGGVIEPDAETLMKARFTAYALSVIPYVVRTTHPENPDFQGVEDFTADVKATCERLRFVKLEVLESQEVSETEAYVSFIVTYSILKGGRGERKYLKEKSIFVKENGRWFYREKEALSQASEAAWMASTVSNMVDPESARKAFNKGTATMPGNLSSGPESRAARIPLKSRTGGK